MVDTLWPANAVAGAPSYNGRMLRQTGAPAFAGATAARPLGGRSGVRPGTPSTTVTSTSTTWTSQPFAGVADVMTAAEASVYAFAFDAVATGAVTAAHATLPRKDIIYVSFADPAESVGATPSATRKYLAGTAAASPVAPSVPGAERGFVIAEINVPVSGGGSPTVTWVAPYCAGAGAVVPFNTKTELDLWTSAPVGAKAIVIADGREYTRFGGAWVLPVAGGTATMTGDSVGRVIVTHGMGTTPLAVSVTIADDTPAIGNLLKANVDLLTSTTFRVRFYRGDDNSNFASNSVKFSWVAVAL